MRHSQFIAFAKEHKMALRLILLCGALSYVTYLVAWHLWRGSVSNVPGFLFIVGSLPWSLPFLDFHWQLVAGTPWPIQNFIAWLGVALGFGANLALFVSLVWFIRVKTHNQPLNQYALQSGAPVS
jgi:signal transduction histidine kinase